MSAVKYSNLLVNNKSDALNPFGLIDSKTSYFGDFVVQNELGFKNLNGITFQGQIGVTNLLTTFPQYVYNRKEYSKYSYNNVWFAFGVIADVKKLFKH